MEPEQRLSFSLLIEACMLFCISWMLPWVIAKLKSLIIDIEIFRTCKKETYGITRGISLSEMHNFKFYNYNFYNYNLSVIIFNIFKFMVNWIFLIRILYTYPEYYSIYYGSQINIILPTNTASIMCKTNYVWHAENRDTNTIHLKVGVRGQVDPQVIRIQSKWTNSYRIGRRNDLKGYKEAWVRNRTSLKMCYWVESWIMIWILNVQYWANINYLRDIRYIKRLISNVIATLENSLMVSYKIKYILAI